ncbi:hypothetical protein PC112_g18864 [Phytophthora cactorum]|nr:hypothetical protein PC112_g18864 [Phytophthora cactorum]
MDTLATTRSLQSWLALSILRRAKLEVTKADSEGLLELEAVLVANNLEQYAQLLYRSKTKDGIVAKVGPCSKWHEMRKVGDFRIYEERRNLQI